MTSVVIEAIGDTTSVSPVKGGAKKPRPEKMTHYRYCAGASPPADFFVDGRGRVTRVDASAADLEYVLVSFEEERNDAGSPK